MSLHIKLGQEKSINIKIFIQKNDKTVKISQPVHIEKPSLCSLDCHFWESVVLCLATILHLDHMVEPCRFV